MSWTQGQSNRVNQSPFVDPINGNQSTPQSSAYGKPGSARYPANNQRQIPNAPHVENTPAATFTKEGLQTFSLIFSSSVEAAIAKTLPDLVERAMEAKIYQFMDGIQRELVTEVSRLVAQMLKDLPAIVKEHPVAEGIRIGATGEALPITETRDVLPTVPPELANTEATDELHHVLAVLKNLGRPVGSEELREMMPDIHWGTNFSAKMNHFITKANGKLERTARGVYAYRQPVS